MTDAVSDRAATAVTFGFSQYRVGADVSLVVLAAAGLAWRPWRQR